MTKTTPTLAEAIEQLEKLEAYFQQSDLNLEESIKKHGEAVVLAKNILERLQKAENELQKVDIAALLATDQG